VSALYLIRHAQAGPRHKYDQLSDLGREQARRLGEYFASQPVAFTSVYSGSLERQRLTAEAVRQAYRGRGVAFPEIQDDPLWNEFDLGDVYRALAEPLCRDDAEFGREYAAMMRSLDDENHALHRNHNYCDIAVIRAWVAARYAYSGESWQAFRARVAQPLTTLSIHNSGERIAVFTSATPISLWVGRALGLDDSNIWRIAGVAYNTAITTLQLRDDDCRLFTFNGVPHLEQTALRTFR
jgi:broad specificity phosphatase PhoE